MTGTINPELPTSGEARGTSDGRVKGSLITIRNGLNALLNEENKVSKTALETGVGALKWYTPKIIATEESRTNTAFGTLETKDEIPGISLPENGLIVAVYYSQWKPSVANAGRAALFLGSNQQKCNSQTIAAVAGEPTTEFTPLITHPSGLIGVEGVVAGALVTTGEAIGYPMGFSKFSQEIGAVLKTQSLSGPPPSGLCLISASAGTYALSVKYRATSGSITVKERRLYVAVLG